MDKKEKFQLKLMEKEHEFQENLSEKRFQREKMFQIFLALLVFLFTIASSLLSGYAVYKLTLDKESYLIISPYRDVNKTFDKLSLQIANIKETPATMIRVYYQIEGAEQKETAEPEIPYLAKGNSFVELDFGKLNMQIEEACKKKLIETNSTSFDEVQLPKEFKVIIQVRCNECTNENVLFTNQIIYSQDIKCSYTTNKQNIDYIWGTTFAVSY